MENIFSVKNKIALITGASSGIGRHFATVLAQQGAHVILVGRNEGRLHEALENCKQYDKQALSITADIQTVVDIEKIFKESRKHFPHLDIVINAAGIGMRVPALDLTEEQWDSVFNTNVKGSFLVAKLAAQWMIETATAGKIINISSSASFHTTKTRAAYSASKIAVESFTRTLALSLAEHNIAVNCIAPGFFVTDLTCSYLKTDMGKSELTTVPMNRAAEVKELNGVLLLLTSNASSYMTGSVLPIDGGFSVYKV